MMVKRKISISIVILACSLYALSLSYNIFRYSSPTKFGQYVTFSKITQGTDGWKNVWATNFTSSSPDLTKWVIENWDDNKVTFKYNNEDPNDGPYWTLKTTANPETHQFYYTNLHPSPTALPLYENWNDPDYNGSWQAFGYYELEARIEANKQGHTAYFLWAPNAEHPGYGGVDGSEIDIFEIWSWHKLNDDRHLGFSVYCDYNKWDYIKGINLSYSLNFSLANDFHKYGLIWTPDRYYLCLDRQILICINPTISQKGLLGHIGVARAPSRIIISLSAAGVEHGLVPDDATFKIDIKGFNVWQNDNFIPYLMSPQDFGML